VTALNFRSSGWRSALPKHFLLSLLLFYKIEGGARYVRLRPLGMQAPAFFLLDWNYHFFYLAVGPPALPCPKWSPAFIHFYPFNFFREGRYSAAGSLLFRRFCFPPAGSPLRTPGWSFVLFFSPLLDGARPEVGLCCFLGVILLDGA